MRYVERDGAGNIVAIYAVAHEGATEVIAPEDPELLGFVTEGSTEDAMRTYLATSDSDLLRILEDMINVLIDNNVMLLTDFPPPHRASSCAAKRCARNCRRFDSVDPADLQPADPLKVCCWQGS